MRVLFLLRLLFTGGHAVQRVGDFPGRDHQPARLSVSDDHGHAFGVARRQKRGAWRALPGRDAFLVQRRAHRRGLLRRPGGRMYLE